MNSASVIRSFFGLERFRAGSFGSLSTVMTNALYQVGKIRELCFGTGVHCYLRIASQNLMRGHVMLRTFLAFSLLLLVAPVALGSSDPLVVHEWGTFTSLQ